MTSQPKVTAELRDWTKGLDFDGRDVFQGRVFNDVSHLHPDGAFITINAHDVAECGEGNKLVTHEHKIYVLWEVYRKKNK